MKVYIASSWRNQHGVELLTGMLRAQRIEVESWIENNFDECHVTSEGKPMVEFEEWVASGKAKQAFDFDTNAAVDCDIFIYYGPAGADAAAELGAHWAAHKMDPDNHDVTFIFGLKAKGDSLGLMRMMVDRWFIRVSDLLDEVIRLKQLFPRGKGANNG